MLAMVLVVPPDKCFVGGIRTGLIRLHTKIYTGHVSSDCPVFYETTPKNLKS